MKTTTLSVTVRCVCVLLILHGLIFNVSAFGGRILYGSVANPADYKFIVNLMYSDAVEDWQCAGSVISYHFILTAAHCAYQRECIQIQISPSTWKLNDVPTYYASECHIHQNFDRGTLENDIALLQTEENLLANSRITLIGLPDSGTDYVAGTMARIIGWGMMENQKYPTTLLQATVRVFDWEECYQIYKARVICPANPDCPIPLQSFCTMGDLPNPSGSCTGDSGGPVIINGELAGVISSILRKNGVCMIGTPSLHVNVGDYIQWIRTYVDF